MIEPIDAQSNKRERQDENDEIRKRIADLSSMMNTAEEEEGKEEEKEVEKQEEEEQFVQFIVCFQSRCYHMNVRFLTVLSRIVYS